MNDIIYLWYMNDIIYLWYVYMETLSPLVGHTLLRGLGEKEEIVLTGIKASKYDLMSIKGFLGITMKEGTQGSVYGKVRLCSM